MSTTTLKPSNLMFNAQTKGMFNDKYYSYGKIYHLMQLLITNKAMNNFLTQCHRYFRSHSDQFG